MSVSKGNNFPKAPSRPSGDNAEAHFMQNLWDLMWDPRVSLFIDSPQIKFDKTPKGYQVQLKPSFGGGGGGISWQTPNKELDPTVAVATDTLVYISANNPLATTGMFDAVLGVNLAAAPGIWLALKSVPAQTSDSPAHYNVPQVPTTGAVSGTPLSGDLDGSTLFWARLEKISTC